MLWQHFSKSKQVSRYLPATKRLNKESFTSYLQRFGMIYVKPSGGSRGNGIMKVWQTGNQVKVKKTVLATRVFSSRDGAWTYVQQQTGRKAHIVQRGLWLAKVGGRPFDIRVMVQRESPTGGWRYSGMVAKVAGKSSVVTNVALSGGYTLTVEEALKRSLGLGDTAIQKRIGELKSVALAASRHFDSYQRYRELGFDMAVDRNGRIWMIEENTLPSHALFKHSKSTMAAWRRIQFRYGHYNRARRQK